MTVDPRLQLIPGEYLIHPDGSASKVVDKRNMTVDEILEGHEYRDRRGRVWQKLIDPIGWVNMSEHRLLTRTQMRLLIERDAHRSECEGLNQCLNHPVAHIVIDFQLGLFDVFHPGSDIWAGEHDSLSEAMDAARALAVGE